ncbi:hypothetical protein GFM29_19040 [Rhizobium leguminosarum bv. viciae]|nr:hypothetical protein [Rhizobium leguminosarum bv. viciae]
MSGSAGLPFACAQCIRGFAAHPLICLPASSPRWGEAESWRRLAPPESAVCGNERRQLAPSSPQRGEGGPKGRMRGMSGKIANAVSASEASTLPDHPICLRSRAKRCQLAT